MKSVKHIPKNGEFSHLSEVLKTSHLAERLEYQLLKRGALNNLNVETCTIEQVHYRPPRGCRIVLKAQIRLAGGIIKEQLFYVQVFRKGRMRRAFNSIDHGSLVPAGGCPPVMMIPEWESIIWAYPNDPNLPGLHFLANEQTILSSAIDTPGKFGLDQAPVAVNATLSRYVPTMRCGYMYEMSYEHSKTIDDEPVHRVYGKAYRKDKGDRAYAILEALWQSAAGQNEDVLVPQPYSFDSDRQIVWQQALSGQSLNRLPATAQNIPEVVHEIGQRLASLHGIPLQLPTDFTLETQIAELRQAISKISDEFPQYASACSEVGEKLLEAAERLEPTILKAVHGSFKLSHIFKTPKGLAFIDLDGTKLGDASYDLGRFIAYVCKLKAKWKISPEVADETVSNFCAAYNKAAADPISQERINWFAASHLICSQIYKAVKRLDGSLVSKLLRMADNYCPA